MKEIEIKRCPFCGGEELIPCTVSSYGGVYLERKLRGAGLYALTCRDCGSVVRFYCKDAEKLFSKKERRNKTPQ